MISISKNVYIDKLDNIVNKQINTHHNAIKIKPVNVKSSTYLDFNKEDNKEDLKFEFGDHVGFPNTKSFLAKVILWSN